MSTETHDATAAVYETPGGRKFRDLINTDQEANAAMCAFVRDCFAEFLAEASEAEPMPRLSKHIVEEFTRTDRDAERANLMLQMQGTNGVRRQLQINRARDLHSSAEHRLLRGKATRRLHSRYYSDLSERAAARFIMCDLQRRIGQIAVSTGNQGKDQLCDEIIVSARSISDRTIRADLAPPSGGQKL